MDSIQAGIDGRSRWRPFRTCSVLYGFLMTCQTRSEWRRSHSSQVEEVRTDASSSGKKEAGNSEK